MPLMKVERHALSGMRRRFGHAWSVNPGCKQGGRASLGGVSCECCSREVHIPGAAHSPGQCRRHQPGWHFICSGYLIMVKVFGVRTLTELTWKLLAPTQALLWSASCGQELLANKTTTYRGQRYGSY